MAYYHEITVWTRGIIMDKEARDIANSLAEAARREGRVGSYISDYVDSPDRTNCLVRKYARLSDRPIEDFRVYENPNPDIIVLIEESLIKAVDYTRTTAAGEGVVVVNSKRDPEFMARLLPDRSKVKKLVVVDATGIAGGKWLYRNLTGLGKDRLSTEGAAELAAVGGGISAPLMGAVVKATGCVTIEGLEAVVADPKAARRGHDECVVLEISGSGQAQPQTQTAGVAAGRPQQV
jgi:oxalate oxidoreductase subunit delta